MHPNYEELKNYLLFIAYFFLSLSLSAQTQRFSSENIDSLLSAYNSHQAIGLPKAYCLDQIMRFYSNPPRDLEKASEYIKAYKSISEALEITDLTTRYQYRNAKLAFLLSGNQVLDTTTYSLVYEYFKVNDPTFCLDISGFMVDHVSKSEKYHPKSKESRSAFIKWTELLGDDHLFNNDPLKAGQFFWISSQEASLENSIRGQVLCRKAIKAYLKGDAARSEIFEAYLWLSDLVFDSKDISNIHALEKEVKTIDDERITSEFYSTLERYKGDLSQEEKNELKAQQLRSVRNSSILVDLPQGQFFFDDCDDEKLRVNRSIKIFGDTISRDEMDTDGYHYNTTYKVMRSYLVKGNIRVLAVDILGEGQENNDHLIMHFRNNRLVMKGYNYDRFESTLDRENEIDKKLLYVRDVILNDNRYDSLISLSTAYFKENEYARISKLPKISENQFEELRTAFSLKLEPSDEKGYTAYELFIASANGQFEAADAQLVMLREMMIEKGFNPFSSMPYFIAKEAERLESSIFLLEKLYTLLAILAIAGVIWLIYPTLKSRIASKQNKPESLALYQIKYASFLILSIIGNPFYQMMSYLICSNLGLGASKSTNVFQVNPMAFIFILLLVFFIRLLIYSLIFTSKEYPFSVKGSNSFLYIFSERHLLQIIGLLSFFIWLSPLEGNIIGFIVFPATIILGLIVSIITFNRLLKTKEILITKNKQH
jgi:hypothetical protein